MNNYGNKYSGIVSPVSGGELEFTDKKNIYKDSHSGVYVYQKADGTLMPLISPTSGMKLTINSDGTYSANGRKFILDDRGIIPTFIPDDTLESAHVDGKYLVGNETGRRFPIRNDGKVIVPFDPIDIDPNLSASEINAYYEARKQRQYNETQEWIDAKIAEDEKINHIAMDEAIKKMEDKVLGTKATRERTNRFLKIIDEEIADGHELTANELEKLNMIINGGKLPEDIPDSEITYDSNYAFLKTKLNQLKAGYGLSEEDLAMISKILDESSKEENKHTR